MRYKRLKKLNALPISLLWSRKSAANCSPIQIASHSSTWRSLAFGSVIRSSWRHWSFYPITSMRCGNFSSFANWVARGAYEHNWGSGEKPELPEWAKAFE